MLSKIEKKIYLPCDQSDMSYVGLLIGPGGVVIVTVVAVVLVALVVVAVVIVVVVVVVVAVVVVECVTWAC